MLRTSLKTQVLRNTLPVLKKKINWDLQNTGNLISAQPITTTYVAITPHLLLRMHHPEQVMLL
ncbi:MAG: hypothetical protein KDD19_25240 [Phaeodactylibacter sp.]|nr:hypothetical protein [Phaeodactylibacter sp.]MCB9048079.1 hypothetical protein [Lewinellaceae bacterium]